MKLTAISLSVLISVAGCAQHSNQIEASYVSPATYSGRSCNQLMAERNEIVSTVNELSAAQDKSATNDAVLTGVALLVFWPAAIAMAATKDNATAVSAAKGNYDAITAQMKNQGCKLPPAPAPTVVPESDGKKRSWE